MVDKILCKDRLPAPWICRHPERFGCTLFPVLKELVSYKPLAGAFDSMWVAVLTISVWRRLEFAQQLGVLGTQGQRLVSFNGCTFSAVET
jgi:hypothetical protein